jgi:isopentenyl-diphosphate delta-isomerase
MEQVVLVDLNDREVGVMEKLQAHETGSLHRAISVFLFNDEGEMLLQQRAADKYHSPLLWTNTCCSHPRPGETPPDAAKRRLREEMGVSTDVSPVFTFVYRADFDNGLVEYEYDHVFVGRFNGVPVPDITEVADWEYVSVTELYERVANDPAAFTAWFRICLEDHKEFFQNL